MSNESPKVKKSGGRLITKTSPESFSQRISNGKIKVAVDDIHAIANMMLFEFNMVAAKLLLLQFQLMEVIKAAPR